MAVERSLIILKPDAVQRGLIGEIIHRLERRGLQFVALKMVTVSRSLAEAHYAVHRGRSFYAGLIEYIASGPVVAAVIEGDGAVAVVRATVGATRPVDSPPGSIRGDLAVEVGRNLIHASDSVDNGAAEVALWFTPAELNTYELANQRWIRE
ncbi:MAG: nucleoside-diphosphate kinase [Chloroflexi bacterium]|nr:nucleoside-diphosphate kinase [Chloroflexota bacterium]